MKSRRRPAGIVALAAAAISVLVIPGAGAQALTYAASADGQALGLSLFGQGLTAGKTHAEVSDAPKAASTGDGILNPLNPVGHTEAAAEADGDSAGSPDETCEGVVDQIPGLAINMACSSSVATVAGGAPGAASSARVGGVSLNPISPLLDTPLAEVVGGAQDGVDQLLGGLAPVLQPIDDATDLGLEDTLGDLFGALFEGAPLATLSIGDTTSTTSVTADAVTSTCTASGGTLAILDQPAVGPVDPPPVITVEIGDSSASVVAATDGSKPVATADPAIVTVRVPSSPQLAEVKLGPGDVQEIPLPEPFGPSTISVAGGTTGEDADGNTFARASAVRLDLLNGEALMGGIELALADCLAVAGTSVTQEAAPATTAPAAPLPRTGGSTPNPFALAATVGLAALGLALLRRTSLD